MAVDVTIIVDRNSKGGTLIHFGDVIAVVPIESGRLKHDVFNRIHVTGVPSTLEKLEARLLGPVYADDSLFADAVRNSRYRLVLETLPQNLVSALNDTGNIEVSWGQLKAHFGRREVKASKEQDTYSLITDLEVG